MLQLPAHKHNWKILRGLNPKNEHVHFVCRNGRHYRSFNKEELRSRLKNSAFVHKP